MKNNEHQSMTVPTIERLVSRLIEQGYKCEALKLIQSVTEGESALEPGLKRDKFNSMRKWCQDHLKVVGIHQPNYFPWLGYFHKIYYSDIFVFLDDVQIGQRSYVNRVYIRDQTVKNYLRIPLKKHHRTDKIQDVYPFQSEWKAHNIALLRAYKNYPYFKDYFKRIERMILDCDVNESISDINIKLIREMCCILNIESQFVKSSTLNVPSMKAQRMVDITRALDGNIYFSGAGARKYQNDFSTPKDVKIIYQEIYDYINLHPYNGHETFINGLSVIDALFCIGTDGILKIFEEYEDAITSKQSETPDHA